MKTLIQCAVVAVGTLTSTTHAVEANPSPIPVPATLEFNYSNLAENAEPLVRTDAEY